MAYNNVMSRTDIAALIPEQVDLSMLTGLDDQSAALQYFRRIPLATSQSRFPVLSALPVAYFVNGDTGTKQTSEVNWANKYINVEEIAVILPIPQAVFDDAGFDVWGATRPLVEQAIGRALDAAIFFGTNKPASWPLDIAGSAVAAGNVVARGTSTSAQGGIAEDINQLMATVEADGYDVNGFVTRRTFRSRLRGARATDGQKLLDINNESIEGVPVRYAMPGLWPAGLSAAEMFAGDWTQQIVGIRQDVTLKVLTESAIFDNAGVLIFNLPQQDMIALRVMARYGWTTANPINYDQATESARYPAAVLRSPAA